MEKQYVHLSRAERDEIFRLLKGGISRRKIATILGRDVSTVSREIKRNQDYLGYLPDTAERKAAGRRVKGTFKIDRYPELKSAVLEGLHKRWSPEDIAAFCYGKTTFCHETIYRYIYHAPWAIKMGLYQLLWRQNHAGESEPTANHVVKYKAESQFTSVLTTSTTVGTITTGKPISCTSNNKSTTSSLPSNENHASC